jgi:hypothetical protein
MQECERERVFALIEELELALKEQVKPDEPVHLSNPSISIQ